MKKTCAVILKGEYKGFVLGDYVICADAGLTLAQKLNVKPDVLIGDLDSLGNAPLDVKTVKFNPEKDFTDGELCLIYAGENGFENVNIYGAEGGSLDHILCNLDLLKRADELNIKATIFLHNGTVELIKGRFVKNNVLGKRISLVPYGAMAHIKYTDGLKYKISKPTCLRPGNMGLGLSDLAVEDTIIIDIESGDVLYFELD